MIYVYKFGFILMGLMIIMSCSEDTPLQPSPPSNKLSTFSAIQTTVFDAGCNTSGCHSGSNPAAGLDLSAGSSYNQLVEVNSVLVPSRKRVDRNSSSESVLVQILRGSVMPQMPPGAY